MTRTRPWLTPRKAHRAPRTELHHEKDLGLRSLRPHQSSLVVDCSRRRRIHHTEQNLRLLEGEGASEARSQWDSVGAWGYISDAPRHLHGNRRRTFFLKLREFGEDLLLGLL